MITNIETGRLRTWHYFQYLEIETAQQANRLHSRSGETVGNQLGRQSVGQAISWLLVGTHVSNGATSSGLPRKRQNRWATSCTSGGPMIGHVFGSPSKAMDACVYITQNIHPYTQFMTSMQKLRLFYCLLGDSQGQ